MVKKVKQFLTNSLIAFKGIYQFVYIKKEIFFSNLCASDIDNKEIAIQRLRNRQLDWKQINQTKVIAIFSINNWESLLLEPLELIGHVTHITWPHIQQFFNTTQEWLIKKNELNLKIQHEFLSHYEEDKNILVFIYSSDFIISKETIQIIKKKNVIVVNFCWDDLLYFKGKVKGQLVGVKNLCQWVDFDLTLSPEAIPQYNRYKAPCFFWKGLPIETSQPQFLLDNLIESISKDFYVLFIGSNYGWRYDFIQKLINKGIKVKCFGNGWPNGTLDEKQMELEIRRAPLTLGFAAVGYTKKITTIKGRDFEVPMLGGLYLTQHSEGLSTIYELNKDVLAYSNIDECYDKICYVIDNPKFAISVRLSGYKKSQKNNTWYSRIIFLRKQIDELTSSLN